jgi:hypothetical protein
VELNVEEQDATRYVKYHTLESWTEVQECETEAAPVQEIVPDMDNLHVFNFPFISLPRREWLRSNFSPHRFCLATSRFYQ